MTPPPRPRRSAVTGAALTVALFRTAGLLLGGGALGPVAGQDPAVADTTTGPAAGALHGRVVEPGGAALSGVFVRVSPAGDSAAWRGAETDDLGYWHLEGLDSGRYAIRAVRLGYETVDTTATVPPDARVDVPLVLEPRAVEIEGLSVEVERSRQRARFEAEAGITARELDAAEMERLPGVVEADPLRAVEVLPGVVTTSDFSSAYNVRGGSADQNLILLDGVPVFNPAHLGGFFSVFNSDMVDRAELRSGGFPPEYGGRVSSVLSIESDPGDGDFHGDAGMSLLAARLAVGGGLSEGVGDAVGLSRGRWKVSGRRSHLDVLLAPVVDVPYHLTDLQGVFEGWTEGGDRVGVTFYTGRDVLDLTSIDPEDFPLRIDWDWGNDAVGLHWASPRDGGGSIQGTLSWSRFSTGLAFPDFQDTRFRSRIDQLGARLSLEARPLPTLGVSAGAGADRYGYDNLFSTGGTVFGEGRGKGWQPQAWLQAAWEVPEEWLVEGGLRGDLWLADPGGERTVLSPRLSVKRFVAGGDWAFKASAGRYSQFLHSIRDEELPIGLDLWVLTGSRAPAVISDQVQGGVEGFPARGWFVSLEGYARSFEGVTTQNRAEDPNDPDDDLLGGTGLSYGVDLMVRRSVGETTGWLAVSLLRARRTFPDELSGREPAPEITFPPVFDRQLDVDLVLSRSLGDDLEIGVRWNVGTGRPYTRPVAAYRGYTARSVLDGRLVWTSELDEEEGGWSVLLGPRNGARYPTRHRLDVSARKTFRTDWGTLTPYASVLNVYNQKNVLFYFYDYQEDPPTRSGVSMFPVLPTLGLEVSFR